MHPKCMTKTYNGQKSFRSETSRLPGPHNHTRWRRPTSRQSPKFPVKTEIPQIQKSTPKVIRILKLLPQFHSETL